MLPLVLTIAAGVVLVLTTLTGVLLPRYRRRRAEYYTRPTMFALIAGLLAVAGGLISLGWTGVAWGVGGLAGWLFLEGLFALIYSGSRHESAEDREEARKRAEQKLIKKHNKKRG